MNTTTQNDKCTHPERPLHNVPTQVPDYPAGWIILAAGIGMLLITPGLVSQEKPAEKQEAGTEPSVRAVRMKELENLITMYERGLITPEEYQELKREIIGRK